MNLRTLTAVALLASAASASAQQQPFGPPTLTPPYDSIVMTEPVAGSDIPVDIMLLETVDGLLTPIGLRKPRGPGPFPIVLLFTGNGGAGIPAVRNYVHGPAGYTMSRFSMRASQSRGSRIAPRPGSPTRRRSRSRSRITRLTSCSTGRRSNTTT